MRRFAYCQSVCRKRELLLVSISGSWPSPQRKRPWDKTPSPQVWDKTTKQNNISSSTVGRYTGDPHPHIRSETTVRETCDGVQARHPDGELLTSYGTCADDLMFNLMRFLAGYGSWASTVEAPTFRLLRRWVGIVCVLNRVLLGKCRASSCVGG